MSDISSTAINLSNAIGLADAALTGEANESLHSDVNAALQGTLIALSYQPINPLAQLATVFTGAAASILTSEDIAKDISSGDLGQTAADVGQLAADMFVTLGAAGAITAETADGYSALPIAAGIISSSLSSSGTLQTAVSNLADGVSNLPSEFYGALSDLNNAVAQMVGDNSGNGPAADDGAALADFESSISEFGSYMSSASASTGAAFSIGLSELGGALQQMASGAESAAASGLSDAAAAIGAAAMSILAPDSPESPGYPTDDPGSDPAAPPAGGGGAAAGAHDTDTGNKQTDPLVISLGGSSIELTALDTFSPYFDFGGTGFAQKTAWAGSNTGFLCQVDSNGNITLFTGDGSGGDGFSQLQALATDGSGSLTSSDPAWDSLRVWVDSNSNGVVDAGEIETLSQRGITAISLSGVAEDENLNGNLVSSISSVTFADGLDGELADVSLATSPTYTKPDTSNQVSGQILTLPQLLGYGALADLHSVMALDPSLVSDVQSFVALTASASTSTIDQAVSSILLEWANVGATQHPELSFDFKYTGYSPVASRVGQHLPDSLFNKAWTSEFDAAGARLILQSPLATILPNFTYNPTLDMVLTSDGLPSAFNAEVADLGTPNQQNLSSWMLFLLAADAVRLDVRLSLNDYGNIVSSGAGSTAAALAMAEAQGLTVNCTDTGTFTITSSGGGDTLYFGQNISYISSYLWGSNIALPPHDSFFYARGDGSAELSETDKIYPTTQNVLFVQGVDSRSVTLAPDGKGGINLYDGSSGDCVELDGQSAGASMGIQKVVFDDGTSWSIQYLEAMANTLSGTAAADNLSSSTPAYTSFDGKGAPAGTQDLEIGNSGGDVFVFNPGYGQLEINEDAGIFDTSTATLQLGAGITASELQASADSSGDVILTDGTAGDQIKIDGQLKLSYGHAEDGVGSITFADGSSLTRQQLNNLATTGTAGADTIYSPGAVTTFDGKGAPAGSQDYEQGRSGSDTFVFNPGYGQLEINEDAGIFDTSTATLQLGAGITASELQASADSSGDVILTDGTAGDQIKIDGQLKLSYGHAEDGVGSITFADGSSLTRQQLNNLATTGTAGADTIYSPGAVTTFDGKGAPAGSQDYEQGRSGSDTFVFNPGYGQLEINEDAGIFDTSTATLQLGDGITAGQLQVTGDTDDNVFLTDGTSGDRIKLDGELRMPYGHAEDGVADIIFADGSILTRQQFDSLAGNKVGSTGADNLSGSGEADSFDGKGAPAGTQDYESGGGGGDTFIYNSGYGQLEINEDSGLFNDSTATLQLGAGITAGQLQVTGDTDDNVFLTDGTSGDRIKLDGELRMPYGHAEDGVADIIFADGSILTRQQFDSLAGNKVGSTGADNLSGSGEADSFDGKGAPAGTQDYESGGGGGDTFIYNSGYGQLEINEDSGLFNDSTATLQLGAGITAGQLQVTGDTDDNVFLTDGTSGDRIKLDGELRMPYGHAEDGVADIIFADGSILTRQQFDSLAGNKVGSTGADNLSGSGEADSFDGKGAPAGTQDYESGGGGGDTFIYNSGYGQLEINEDSGLFNDSTATLQLGAGITAGQLQVTGDTDDNVFLTDGTSGDRIKLDGELRMPYGHAEDGVADIIFADGSILTRQQFDSLAGNKVGSTGADNLSGSGEADSFDGKGAPAGTQDYESGGGGGDTFIYNSGYGQLEINEDSGLFNDSTATLQLGAGITAGQLQVTGDTDDNVFLTDGTSGDRIKLDGELRMPYGHAEDGVADIIFADGSILTRQQFDSLAGNKVGSTGADNLSGSGEVDVFDGKGAPAGSQDYESGGGGGDTFIYNSGYGQLEINEDSGLFNDSTATLQLGAGITAGQLQVTGDTDDNVFLTDGTSGDRIKLDGELRMPYGHAEDGVADIIFADGSILTRQQFDSLAGNKVGTAGADNLSGSGEVDVFDGKGAPAGSQDYESGGGGGDTFVYNQGYGQLEVNELDFSGSTDVLRLGAGITAASVTVTGDSSSNVFITDGTSGDQVRLDNELNSASYYGVQTVQFADGSSLSKAQLIALSETKTGTSGADNLSGSGAADVFDGKGAPAGSQDYESGGGGGDTFVYNQGYGQLEVNELDFSGSTDVLRLGAGITASGVTVTGDSSSNVFITDGTSGDQVRLDNELNSASYYGVQTVQFADGSSLSKAQLIALSETKTGTSGADNLSGSGAADVFDGKGAPAGSQDYESGGGGGDTFVYNQGYGQLEVNELDFSGSTDVLRLGAGITAASVTVTGDSSSNVFITDGTSGDQVRLDNELNSASYYGVQTVQFADGSSLSKAQLIALSETKTGTSGADNLSGSGAADVFDGKGAPAGSQDYESGGGGGDTFVYNQGYGQLEVNELDFSGSTDVLRLGAGITAASVTVTGDSSSNVFITDGTSGDQVRLDNELNSASYYGVQTVQFADGSSLSKAQLIALSETKTGTSGADNLSGSGAADVFDGKGAPAGSQDYESGGGGGDTFVYNQGYGQLEVNELDFSGSTDVLRLGAGITAASVTVTGDSSSNVFITDGTSGDQVRLDNELNSASYYGVQTVQFADGSSLSKAQLTFLAGNKVGTAGADNLSGSGEVDVFDGKGAPAGTQDYESGGGGGDTFVYNQGYGQLEVNELDFSGSTDVLRLGAGITAASVTVTGDSSSNVFITDGTSGDQVRLDNELNSASYYGVQTVQFADGSSLSKAQLTFLAGNKVGTAGADNLSGSGEVDVFDGKGAPAGTQDYESGGGGGDTFVYNQGYGQLEVNELDFSGSTDVLRLGAGITASGVTVTGDSSGNVFIADGTSGDQIRLDNELNSASYYGVQTVQFSDGSSLSKAQMTFLAGNKVGSAGADSLSGSGAADVFDGKGAPAGSQDYESGGGGGDTFVYNQGYGQLEVNELDFSGSSNALQFGFGITPSQINISIDNSSNLIIADSIIGDSIKIDNGASSASYYGLQSVLFNDGTVWSKTQLIAASQN